jgi:hypothetical protein
MAFQGQPYGPGGFAGSASPTPVYSAAPTAVAGTPGFAPPPPPPGYSAAAPLGAASTSFAAGPPPPPPPYVAPPGPFMHPVAYPAAYAPVAVTSPMQCLRPGCPCDSWDGKYGNYCSTTCHQGTPCAARAHPFAAPGTAVVAPPPPPPIPTTGATGTTAQCARPGCPCDSWNGQQGNCCCNICHNGTACASRIHIFTPPPPKCLRQGCPCDSWNGLHGNYCSTTCHNGVACTTKLHTFVPPPPPPPPAVRCLRAGCPCDSWNGLHGNYCSTTCHNGVACAQRHHSFNVGGAVRCARPGCPCDSHNGQATEHCCKACKNGTACAQRFHAQPGGAPAVTAGATSVRCASSGCPCDSWNGQLGEHCCKGCKGGQACSQRKHVYSGAPVVQQQQQPAPQPQPQQPAPVAASANSGAPRCANPACPCDSWNGHLGEHCCKGCKGGQVCPQRRHAYTGPLPTPAQPAPNAAAEAVRLSF